MLDTSKLKIGSQVRLTVNVVKKYASDGFGVRLSSPGSETMRVTDDEMQKGKLVSTPVEFSDEQIEAIKEWYATITTDEWRQIRLTPPEHFVDWLEAHREKK